MLAIVDFHMNHKVTSTATQSAALAIKNGCDLNCGNVYLQMMLAYKEGLVTEEDITIAAERLMSTRIRLGMFDNDCEYDEIPYEANDSKENNQLSLEAARKSMVLLRNNGILPLDKTKVKSIAVIGPNADSKIMLEGNYHGTASKYTTILEGIHDEVGEDVRVYYSEGCHLYKEKVGGLSLPNDRLSEAISIAKKADVAILCLGLDSTIEGEQGDTGNSEAAGDKSDLNLPGKQQELLESVIATGTPVIVVLGTGSALTFNNVDDRCSAILNAWYPGSHGGRAVADLLFGKYSPSGKLPITFYKGIENLPHFEDYSMNNRTYRYMNDESLYSFGYGLTYSNVELSNLKVEKIDEEYNFNVKVHIKNIGSYDIEEVVQCYIKDLESKYAVKNHSLAQFKRVSLKIGETKTIKMSLNKKSFEVVDYEGNRVIDSKKFKLFVGISQPDTRSIELLKKAPMECEISL